MKKWLFLVPGFILLLISLNFSNIVKESKSFLLYDNHGTKDSLYYDLKIIWFKLSHNLRENHILMLGDSITDYGKWNNLLKLDDIQNHGIIGDRTQGVLTRLTYIDNSVKKVFIMIGINDIIVGKELNHIIENYKNIIKVLRSKNLKIYIQSTLYTGKTHATKYNDKVTKLNQFLQDYSQEKNIPYIDVNSVLSKDGVMIEKYSDDDLHINEKGYVAWAKLLRTYL